MSVDALLIAFAATLAVILLSPSFFRKKTRPNPHDSPPAQPSDVSPPPPPPPRPFSSGHDYEVFLSFRGADTRTGFTDFLYHALKDAGVRVFRDDDELRVGEEIGSELLRNIRRSKISIPVFSEDYASSKWCLQELAEMAGCRRRGGQLILPVFYGVEPAAVRHQGGAYGRAFESHERRFSPETVRAWREALQEVGALKGWDVAHVANGHEGQLVKIIKTKVLSELKKAYLVVADYLVGVTNHVEAIKQVIGAGTSDVKILGIYGMGGIGKTTVAKVIYNQLSHQFVSCCFLADVRETSKQHKGLESLQNQLVSSILKGNQPSMMCVDDGINIIRERFSNKKVLLLLDDVDQKSQLDALVGKREWFGPGSKIIITTRNKYVLDAPELEVYAYIVEPLNHGQSLRLFSKHAFRRDFPPTEYASLSDDIVSTTGGLPLAIEITGSLLCDKPKGLWQSTLDKLNKIPDGEVQKKLRISYEALSHEEKQIFLDIACYLIGTERRLSVLMWEDRSLFPENALEVLVLMSLVKIEKDNILRMHDQLRDLGREIVRQECFKDLGKRSRLWNHEEALEVLKRNVGTANVEALCLDFRTWSQGQHFLNEHFSTLISLKFLKLDYVNLSGDFENLLPELRWLQWHGCLQHFPVMNFRMDKLVILDLSWSKITENWKGWNQMKMPKLKVLNLTGCTSLVKTPDFSGYINLERLILERCGNLDEIHQSIGHLKHLVVLNLRYCTKLYKLPNELGDMEALVELLIDGTSIQYIPVSHGLMMSLETLSATHFQSVTQISSSIGHLQSLLDLALDGAEIAELPESMAALVKLRRLSLRYCGSLKKLPQSIGQLKSLIELDLSRTGITELPDTIGELNYLEILNISYSGIKKLPPAIGMLQKLEELHASSCKDLEGEVPSEIGKLSLLKILTLDYTDICCLPEGISRLSRLQKLDLLGCTELQCIPELPCSLTSLRITCLWLEKITVLFNLINLKELCLSDCYKLIQIPGGISNLQGLESLILISLNIRQLPAEIGAISQLKHLTVQDCKELQCIEAFPSSLVKLYVRGCESLETLPDLSNLSNLLEFVISTSYEQSELDDLERKTAIRDLYVQQSKSLQHLDMSWCISDVEGLKDLQPVGCRDLIKAEGLNKLESLEHIDMSCCTALENLSDLSGLRMLKVLDLRNCENLQSVVGLEKLTSLRRMDISRCKKLEEFPDITELKCLHELRMQDCEKLMEIRGLDHLGNLEFLDLSGCKSLESLPCLSHLQNMRELRMRDCWKLTEIRGLEKLKLLEFLDISRCKSFEHLPDLSKLKKLWELQLQDCEKLTQVPGLKKLKSLKFLDTSGCKSISKLPDLASLKQLKHVK